MLHQTTDWKTISQNTRGLRGKSISFSKPFESFLLFSGYVMFDSLWPHGLQLARPPWLSLFSGVCPSSRPLNELVLPSISSSVALFSFCLQSFLASGSFPKSALSTRWPKYWSFSFSISPSNEFSGLMSFRIDRFDLLAIQGTLRSLL